MTDEQHPNATFASPVATTCPAYAELSVASERAFRPVDGAGVAVRLEVERRATAVAREADASLVGEGDNPASWMLAGALPLGRAGAPVRVAHAVELALRAGIPARPARLRAHWHAGVPRGAPVLAPVGVDRTPECACSSGGCVCAREVAFLVSSGLACTWRAERDMGRGKRGNGLRTLLSPSPRMRAHVLIWTLVCQGTSTGCPRLGGHPCRSRGRRVRRGARRAVRLICADPGGRRTGVRREDPLSRIEPGRRERCS